MGWNDFGDRSHLSSVRNASLGMKRPAKDTRLVFSPTLSKRCGRGDLNPQGDYSPVECKSTAFASFATPAKVAQIPNHWCKQWLGFSFINTWPTAKSSFDDVDNASFVKSPHCGGL